MLMKPKNMWSKKNLADMINMEELLGMQVYVSRMVWL